jgi:hypothetical protein
MVVRTGTNGFHKKWEPPNTGSNFKQNNEKMEACNVVR